MKLDLNHLIWTLDLNHLIWTLYLYTWYLTWPLTHSLRLRATTCYTCYYLLWSSHNHSIDAPMLCTLVWLERCTTPSLIIVIDYCYDCYWPAGAYGCILVLSWLVTCLGYGHLDYDLGYMIYYLVTGLVCIAAPHILGVDHSNLGYLTWYTWLDTCLCLGVKYWKPWHLILDTC